MKSITTILFISSFFFFHSVLYGQEEGTGMPGDHFSLEGALDLFKDAKSIEAFEEALNDENNEVNNLDLNQDGEVDFVKVIAHQEKDAHAITLQVPISKKEAQDIAIIAIEKTSSASANLQIIGDEEIYGEALIVEPYDEMETSTGKGPNGLYEVERIVVNVWMWPSVRYVYRPVYRPYVSPWYWGYYPKWWRPWRPVSLLVYRPRVRTWGIGYRVTPTVRVKTARNIYVPRRRSSVTVVKNYSVNKTTYVNNRTVVKRSSSTTVVKNNNKAVAKKTSTRVAATNGKTRAAGVKKTKTVKAQNKGKKVGVKKTKTKKAKVKKRKR